MTVQFTAQAALIVGVLLALVAGVFFAFSDFIMRALAKTSPASAGLAAMQAINRVVYRSAFLVTLLGLAPALVALTVIAALADAPGLAWLTVGSGTYLLGVIAVTMIGNVPMNKRLDRFDCRTPPAEDYWQVYLKKWTYLNHLRSVAASGAALCFLIAAMARG